MRFFIKLSYKGTNYHGWQIQPNANTIQQEINKALSSVLNEEIQVMGAGRTDTGVHAKKMFAHFDYNIEFQIEHIIYKLNSLLPSDITVISIFKVREDANCRFDALSRTYQYHIINRKDPFNMNAYLVKKALDLEVMNQACQYIIGKKDFSSFAKANTQTFTNNCNVMFANWELVDHGLVFTIKSNRFLRNMVRAIVGTLIDVGFSKISPDSLFSIIESKDRSSSGTSVPACGLFLMDIEYPKDIILK